MKFMLDTNICIYIINARPPHVLERFRHEAIGDIGISAMTAAELAYGVAKSGSTRNRAALEKFFAPLEIAPFDGAAFWRYGDVRAALERRGQPIGAIDTLIAAPMPWHWARHWSRIMWASSRGLRACESRIGFESKRRRLQPSRVRQYRWASKETLATLQLRSKRMA
jgi:tRNA(fMet)-specific endonuclease VapC